ncbi:MAG: glycosyltransferase family 2 protein [Candidatus Omnitrophica bacterium]|nr:glycosyltransferase family 2 protein [Candidatus Omnitrophota bacterium]
MSTRGVAVSNLKISFSLPVLNAARTLERCLESIRGQDYPQDDVEILVADGGSTDETVRIAQRYGARIFDNPARLADQGAKINARHASGALFIIFAADNELGDRRTLSFLSDLFSREPDLASCWGPMRAGPGDPSLNRYYELIQNDPLSWFINRNLKGYLRAARRVSVGGREVYLFKVDPARPLIWGANGLTYRTEWVRGIITVPEFVGDNDCFQLLMEQGHAAVAYCPSWRTVHHHVETLSGWGHKWRRDFVRHFLSERKTRNMNWAFDRSFRLKLALWILYTLFIPASLLHALVLALKDKRPEWLWHPWASLVQFGVYATSVLGTCQGRSFISEGMLHGLHLRKGS